MKTTAILILSFLLITFVYGQKKQVRKRTSKTVTYYDKGDGKIRHSKRTDDYIVYDKQGREIELATYGEVSESHSISEDGIATISDRWDNSRIFISDFTTYDGSGRKLRVDTWLYHDNRKYVLWDHSIFKYNDRGLPVKELRFNGGDTIQEKETYGYDKTANNIEVIDSSFNKYPGVKLSILRTENQFDGQNRLVLTTMFSDGKFLLRKKFFYDENNVIELRYDKETDGSLWSETETTYGRLVKAPSEVCWQTVGPDSVETDEIYFRDADGLLLKIETYSKGELTGVTRFSYKYY